MKLLKSIFLLASLTVFTSVSQAADPIGSFDEINCNTISGWAVDFDAGQGSIAIKSPAGPVMLIISRHRFRFISMWMARMSLNLSPMAHVPTSRLNVVGQRLMDSAFLHLTRLKQARHDYFIRMPLT
jgi:hypothetical protein